MKKIIFKNEIEQALVSRATGVIKDNGILIHPTENLYGFGALIQDIPSIQKIIEIKQRKKNTKGFVVLVADYIQLDRLIEGASKTEKKCMQKYWPGPLTIILKAKKAFWKNPVCYKKKIAVRMVGNDIMRAILKEIDMPMISTSINISGEQSLNDPKLIIEKYHKLVDGIVIDNIHHFSNKPSTIIKIIGGQVIVLRKGAILKPNPRLK
ncbi:MAG: threonylcarbamoyl-AMP synthase [Candidatus Cloacimonetes bacterium]|nr:threonylcarbamoyl-AMP synthase [Candidatus Cloacimonadota bacterium]